MKLITSAAYIDVELAAEFGKIPPALLPVGHSRLYEAQIAALERSPGQIYLSLPENYDLPKADQISLEKLRVGILRVPVGLKLGESILYALEISGSLDGSVCILHGDTLLELPDALDADLIAIAPAPENYDWGVVDWSVSNGDKDENTDQDVLAGYFLFQNAIELRRSLARAQGDFLGALKLYDEANPLLRIRAKNWLDFGHIQTYYRSRCNISTQRAFNSLDLTFKSVRKSSVHFQKIESEALWFQNIPDALRVYTPAFLGSNKSALGQPEYSMEYLPLPTLHELFVFGALSENIWRRIMESCSGFISDCRINRDALPREHARALDQLMRSKTQARLKEFSNASGVSLTKEWRFENAAMPSLTQISELTLEMIDFDDMRFLGVMHGDLCFTNIFFDFRTYRIRVIDPRGSIDNQSPTVWGDLRYDIAKLCHSAVGLYDLVLAGRFEISGVDSRDVKLSFFPSRSTDTLQTVAEEYKFAGLELTSPQVLAMAIHLFLSMLPLHSDRADRQNAFIGCALRLFQMLEQRT